MNEFRVELTARELDLARCLTAGQVFRWVQDGDHWRGSDGDLAWILRQDKTGITARTNGTPLDFDALFGLTEHAQGRLDQCLRVDPGLRDVASLCGGLRLMQPRDSLETLLSFICTANNHIKRISQMVRALEQWGSDLPGGLHRFPRLDQLRSISESELRERGFGYRAKSIVRTVGELQARGEAWLESLRSATYESARTELMQLPGVGPKVADCVLLFGLGFGEAVPVDVHMWRALVARYHPELEGQPFTVSRATHMGRELRDRFGTDAGRVHHILFYEQLSKPR